MLRLVSSSTNLSSLRLISLSNLRLNFNSVSHHPQIAPELSSLARKRFISSRLSTSSKTSKPLLFVNINTRQPRLNLSIRPGNSPPSHDYLKPSSIIIFCQQRQGIQTMSNNMRSIRPSSYRDGVKEPKPPAVASRIASFLVTVFVASTTASVSYAAYYCVTSLVLFSSIIPGANGDTTSDSEMSTLFKEEMKTDSTYGYEYVGFDTYSGIPSEDASEATTAEVKAKSVKILSRALEAAGLDDNGIIKDGIGEHITLHPMHVHRSTCPVYGCPFLPLDVHYEDKVREALNTMKLGAKIENKNGDKYSVLKSSGSDTAATLTLIGFKGGKLEDQVNQDRAFVFSPYKYWNINNSSDPAVNVQGSKLVARLLGTFDGHAKYGERVSEYVAKTLPALLGAKLFALESSKTKNPSKDSERRYDHKIAQLLHETFIQLDATAPADPSGGCTASLVLQLDSKIFVANAGDSRSFVAVHIIPPDGEHATTSIIYGTREDKPHLTVERERVEHMGGDVFIPNGFFATGKGTTRVVYHDPTTGSTSGLAMSRSIGDWDAGYVGVIPDPLVDIMDMQEIKKRILEKLNGSENQTCIDGVNKMEVDPASGDTIATSETNCKNYTKNDIKVFAISATDGLLDYVPAVEIAEQVANGLYNTGGHTDLQGTQDRPTAGHPLTACENLIYLAANGWQQDKKGRYRDDIAIAVADLG